MSRLFKLFMKLVPVILIGAALVKSLPEFRRYLRIRKM